MAMLDRDVLGLWLQPVAMHDVELALVPSRNGKDEHQLGLLLEGGALLAFRSH